MVVAGVVLPLVVDVGAADLPGDALHPTPINNNAVTHAARFTPLGRRFRSARSIVTT
ncbi:MAG: hypothetical protein M3Q30_00090 [Actinomycetota bacterium]|nr:hypothetical protein [Actinomycetota bacterium]